MEHVLCILIVIYINNLQGFPVRINGTQFTYAK